MAPAERNRIRAALIDLCFERGFANLSVAALCERADVDRAVFDSAYCDLADCFFAVYKFELERYRYQVAAAREGLTAWPDRVRATAYALYRFVSADERVAHFTTVEVRGAGERVQLLFGGEFDALFDLIDEGRAVSGAPTSLTRSTAESVGGGVFNQIYAAAGRRGPMPPESEVVPQLLYGVFLPYLGAERAAQELSAPAPPTPPLDPIALARRRGEERDRIVAALVELCFERGFRELTVAALCERAGVGEEAFQRHFVGLEECFCETYRELRDWALGRVERALGVEPSWRRRMRAAGYALLRAFNHDEQNTHLAMVEVRYAGERAALLLSEAIDRMVDLIDEGRAERDESDTVSRATAESIGGAIFNQISTALTREFPLSERAVPHLLYAAVLPYLGPEAAGQELRAAPPLPADER